MKCLVLVLIVLIGCSPPQRTAQEPVLIKKDTIAVRMKIHDNYIKKVLESYPELFDSVLRNMDKNGLQIIYTRIDRGEEGSITFTNNEFGVDDGKYFYPASTVKLPVAILALQKLNELNIPGLDKNSMMITEPDHPEQTEVYNDPNSEDGAPSIANYIKKILLVSDNDAFNRLYEFLGQEYINRSLQAMGYDSTQIIHRLNIFLTEEENRRTNPVKFYSKDGTLLYEKPSEISKLVYASRNTKMGEGFMGGDKLIQEPFDFSKKNRLSLRDLHNIVTSIIFPETRSVKQRFNLSADDIYFLRKYMSMLPRESVSPQYDTIEYKDSYVKFLFFGGASGKSDSTIRSFNKTGDAYGFMIDAAYIVDFRNNIEFLLSAVIHCNSDGIFNDDKYDYDSIGYPFMKNLGKAIYEQELKIVRKFNPDLSDLKLTY